MLMANIVGVENVVNKESFIKMFCHFSFFFRCKCDIYNNISLENKETEIARSSWDLCYFNVHVPFLFRTLQS